MRAREKPFQFDKKTTSVLDQRRLIEPEAVIEIALSGDVEEFGKTVTRFPHIVNLKDDHYGSVPMHVACSKNNVPLIDLLVRKGANIDAQDIYGNTPLHYAIDKQRKEAVMCLLRHGCDVNVVDYRGNTPLHAAAKSGNVEIVDLLLKRKADPEAMDYANKRPYEVTKSAAVYERIVTHIEELKVDKNIASEQIVNWLGMGIGLGVGLGLSLARQQQFYIDQARMEEERKRAQKEEERKKRIEEMNAQLMKSKAGARKFITKSPSVF